MPKGYLINPLRKTIRPATFEDIRDMNTLIGGHLEAAYIDRETGDVLYVDEEGLLKDRAFFRFLPVTQLLAGNGLLVGREVEGDEYPGGWTNLDPESTLGDLRAKVIFATPRSQPCRTNRSRQRKTSTV